MWCFSRIATIYTILKSEKHLRRNATFSQVLTTLLKVTLLHGCLSSFCNLCKWYQIVHCITYQLILGSRYSRIDQVKFMEERLLKNWIDMVCLSRPYHFKFLMTVFHKFYLVHSWCFTMFVYPSEPNFLLTSTATFMFWRMVT